MGTPPDPQLERATASSASSRVAGCAEPRLALVQRYNPARMAELTPCSPCRWP
jgi:hypothetical protein